MCQVVQKIELQRVAPNLADLNTSHTAESEPQVLIGEASAVLHKSPVDRLDLSLVEVVQLVPRTDLVRVQRDAPGSIVAWNLFSHARSHVHPERSTLFQACHQSGDWIKETNRELALSLTFWDPN